MSELSYFNDIFCNEGIPLIFGILIGLLISWVIIKISSKNAKEKVE